MNGFILIDKEKGLNSFKLVLALRRLTGQKRVGFAGTLDPLATGLMVMALGEYTKLLPYLESRDKVYQVTVKLGFISDTYDAEGKIEEVNFNRRPTRREIKETLNKFFKGKIKQIPPLHSAIKIEGKRAYQLARKGENFKLKARDVEIFYTRILGYDFPLLKLDVHCSSGTYVRSLANDLGERLGCGGVVEDLRRMAVGNLKVNQAGLLKNIKKENLADFFVPPEVVFADRPVVDLTDREYEILAKGNFVEDRFGLSENLPESVAMAFYQRQIVGVLEKVSGESKLKFKKKLLIF